jgi:hypothetical protein
VITMRQVKELESVNVDFDEYVPLTITWSNANTILETPRYVEVRDRNGYLELKFHPSMGILIEVVLAAAPGVQVEQVNLSPRNSEDVNLMPFLDSGDAARETMSPLVIKAYRDYLYVSFGPDPDQWVGSGPVLFGLAEERNLTAICARWTGSERDSVLADYLDWRLHEGVWSGLPRIAVKSSVQRLLAFEGDGYVAVPAVPSRPSRSEFEFRLNVPGLLLSAPLGAYTVAAATVGACFTAVAFPR